jgi:hypothetical protein
MSKYKKIAKNMLIENAWDRKFGEPLPTLEDVMKEAESMSLQPKGGGKTVVFKNKDNYDKAKKSGDYEEPEETDDGGEKEDPSGKLGAGDFDRPSVGKSFTGPQGDKPDGMYGEPDDEEPSDKPSGDKTKKTGFLSKNKPQKAKDLANDPSADTGPDSRGTEWSGDYFGADDSAEWQDDYEEAEEDEDEEKLAQIRWFGEKQGWGENGEIGGKSARTGKELDKNETLKIDGKMYKKVQEQKETTTGKHPLRETYEKIGGM